MHLNFIVYTRMQVFHVLFEHVEMDEIKSLREKCSGVMFTGENVEWVKKTILDWDQFEIEANEEISFQIKWFIIFSIIFPAWASIRR